MSDNPNSHFQIPAGDHQPDVRADDVLGNVYELYGSQAEKTVELPIYLQSQAEKLRNIALVKLQDIGSEIEKARTDKLKSQPIQRIFVKDIAKKLFNQNTSDNSYETFIRNKLISQESAIGASIFGLKTNDTERHEFFFDGRDENGVDSWFFHQDFGDNNSRTLHYEVLPAGVLLVGTGYLQAEELNKFMIATEMYHEKVISQIYSNNEIANNRSRSVSSIGKVIKLFNKNDNRGNGQLAA